MNEETRELHTFIADDESMAESARHIVADARVNGSPDILTDVVARQLRYYFNDLFYETDLAEGLAFYEHPQRVDWWAIAYAYLED